MNWTIYCKITGEILAHNIWPRGEPMPLPDNQAATRGHIDATKCLVVNGRPVPRPKT